MKLRSIGGLCAVSCALLGCVPPPPGAESATASNAAAAQPNAAADPDPGAGTAADGTPYVWRSVPILGGGFVTGVIFSELEKDLIYARTDIGGAYRWDAKAGSWVSISDHLSRDDANYMGIESLAIDPVDANKVYIAGGTYTQDWAGGAAMLRSSDRGATWQVTPMPFKMGGNENGRSNGERLAVDPNQPKILFFGSRKAGLWKSEDGSQSWKKVESFPVAESADGLGVNIVLFDTKSGQKGRATTTLYAALAKTDSNLYVSRDAGGSWQPVPNQPKGLMPSHMGFDAGGELYVSYGNLPGPSDVTNGAVYKFDPRSKEWVDVSPIKPGGDDKFGYGGLSVDPRKRGHVLATSIDRWTMKDEAFRTTDGGKTWKKIGQSGTWDSAGALYLHHGKDSAGITHWIGDVDIDPFNPNRGTLVGGTGIWMAENLNAADSGKPVAWRFTNKGLEETAVLSITSPPAGAPLLSGVGDICGFKHDDLDAPPPKGAYSSPSCNGTTGIDFAETKPEFVARVGRVWGQDPHGAYSEDGGATWVAFKTEPSGSNAGGMITVTSDAATLLWSLKGHSPSFSRDRGVSWQEVKGVRPGAKLPDWTNMDLQPAADRVNPKLVYIYDAQQGLVYVSHDAGASFDQSASGLPALADYQLSAASIQAVPGFEGHVWITTGKELYRSSDAGKTFNTLGSVQESYGIGVGKAAPGRKYPALYLAGQVNQKKAFYRSDDIGQTWARINDDAHQFGFVNLIEGDPRVYGRVFLGTSGRGVLYGTPNNQP